MNQHGMTRGTQPNAGQNTAAVNHRPRFRGGAPGMVAARRVPTSDLLVWAVVAALLTFVWRVHDLYGILALLQMPSLAMLVGLYCLWSDKDPRRRLATIRHPIGKLLGFLFFLAALSVPTSVYQGLSFRFVIDDFLKNGLLFILVAASVRSFRDLTFYAVAMMVGAVVYSTYVLMYFNIGSADRLGSLVFYDSNDLGMLLVCTLPLAMFFSLRGAHFLLRLFAIACLPLFVLLIVQSGSRGALLAVIAVGVYLLFFLRAVSLVKRWLAVGAIVVAFSMLGNEKYWSMMETLLNPQDDYNWSGQAESGRVEVWKRGMGYMMSRPLTGVGANAFGVAEGTISPLADRQSLGVGLKWSAAHNSFVQVGAELGVFGLIAFVALLVIAFRTARSSFAQQPGRTSDEAFFGQALAASILGYAVAGFFLSQAYGSLVFGMMGMTVALSKLRSLSRPDAVIAAAPASPGGRNLRRGWNPPHQ